MKTFATLRPLATRLALCALVAGLAALVPAAAQATDYPPIAGATYRCVYGNGTVEIARFNLSRVNLADGSYLLQGTEDFYNYGNGFWDARKVTFAKPQPAGGYATKWEFTINPSGPQCKHTVVSGAGYWIDFIDCGASSRSCEFQY